MANHWQHQAAVRAYNPVDHGDTYLDYDTKAHAAFHMPVPDLRSGAGQNETFSAPDQQPRFANPYKSTIPVTSDNLDRWLSSTSPMCLEQSIQRTRESGFSQEQAFPALVTPETFYSQKTVMPEDSQRMWSSIYQGQSIPPPPPGPPPTDPVPARMHSVIREIAVPPLKHGGNSVTDVPTLLPLSFRQPARSQAPLPLKDRGLAHAAPKVPSYHLPFRRDVSSPPFKTQGPPVHRSRKPSAINIGLACGPNGLQDCRSVLTAPISDSTFTVTGGSSDAQHEANTFHHYPKTAVIPSSQLTGPWAPSPVRGVALTPLDTQNTHDSRSSVLVDLILSPSLVSDVSKLKSPVSRSSQSSPSLWSPQTPRAMSFDNVVLVQDTTPPLPTLEWLNERPQTIIEEDIQDETPMEVDPPRGRIGDHPDASLGQRQNRARSCSPPPSAYPKESPFNWGAVDYGSRSATDDDLYCLTPALSRPIVDSVKYKPTNSAFDVRQTILGCYFKC